MLQQAVLANSKITVMWNSTVREFKAGDGGMLATVVVQGVEDDSNVTEIPAEAAFVAIGHIPNTQVPPRTCTCACPCVSIPLEARSAAPTTPSLLPLPPSLPLASSSSPFRTDSVPQALTPTSSLLQRSSSRASSR